MAPVPDDGPALSDYDRAMREIGFNVGGSNLSQQTAEEQVDAVASDDAETSASEPEEPGTEEADVAPDHRFEFMDSVRSVGPTGSGEGGLGRIDAVEEQAADLSVSATPPPSDQPDRRHVVSPIVARLAMTLGIDITTVQGTGIGGRVTRDDMLRAAEQVAKNRKRVTLRRRTLSPGMLPQKTPWRRKLPHRTMRLRLMPRKTLPRWV